MEPVTNTLNLLPSNTAQVALFVQKVKDEVLSGDYNVLDVLIQLRAAQDAIDILNKDSEIVEAASKEYAKHGQKTLDYNGAKITEKEAGTKYDYDGCKDPVHGKLKSDALFAAERCKERETFLKALKEPVTIIDEQTGEVVKLNPPSKTSKTILSITLK